MSEIINQLTPEDFCKSFDKMLFSDWKKSVEEHKQASIINIALYLTGLALMILLGGLVGISLFFILTFIGIAMAMPKHKKRKEYQRKLGVSNSELNAAIVKCRNRIK